MTHKQPAFDHPALIGEKPLVNNDQTSLPLIEITSAATFTECPPMQEPPERPRSNHSQTENSPEKLQLWTTTGETCPEGTIPIRRTREEDFLRARSSEEFGRKAAAGQALIRAARSVRRDSSSNNHEVPTINHCFLFLGLFAFAPLFRCCRRRLSLHPP